ncbi:MAG: hypothetical protein WCG01_04565 [bacterium]
MSKSLVMMGTIIGSTIGGYVPVYFGLSAFSFTALFASFVGGLFGIWLVIKFVGQ